ncbi:MAG: lamin tail domain-containing protein [Parcubacteria group bacterium]|nr:lamin tail domain-containing protein [Parcubacteria group bacterium]
MRDIFLIVFVFLMCCIGTPLVYASDVRITEIMYDPDQIEEGITERYYEWIEICNSGETDVLLTDWRLAENGYVYDKANLSFLQVVHLVPFLRVPVQSLLI